MSPEDLKQRDDLVAGIIAAATDLHIPISYLRREAFKAWAKTQPDSHRYTQHKITKYGKWQRLKAMAEHQTPQAQIEPVAKERVQDCIEKREVSKERAYSRKLERWVGDGAYLSERLEDTLARAVRIHPPVLKYQPPPLTTQNLIVEERAVVAVMSDTHYGYEVDPTEVPGGRFSWLEAARRTAAFCEALALEAEASPTLHLVLAGDLIEGAIHLDDKGIDHMATQIDGARQILTSAIDYLSGQFQEVFVECAIGNHDRWPHRNGGKRVGVQKWDSAVTSIYRALEVIFGHKDNVTVSMPRTPWCLFDVCGHQVWASHGDNVLNLRHPRKTLALSRILQDLLIFEKAKQIEPIAYVIGHHHCPLTTPLPGTSKNARLIVNGDLKGETAFGHSIGIFAGGPSQTYFTVTKQQGLQYSRIVDLAQADDREELDAIIPKPTPIGVPQLKRVS